MTGAPGTNTPNEGRARRPRSASVSVAFMIRWLLAAGLIIAPPLALVVFAQLEINRSGSVPAGIERTAVVWMLTILATAGIAFGIAILFRIRSARLASSVALGVGVAHIVVVTLVIAPVAMELTGPPSPIDDSQSTVVQRPESAAKTVFKLYRVRAGEDAHIVRTRQLLIDRYSIRDLTRQYGMYGTPVIYASAWAEIGAPFRWVIFPGWFSAGPWRTPATAASVAFESRISPIRLAASVLILTVPFMVLVQLPVLIRWWNRARRGHCVHCDYRFTHDNAMKCTECGEPRRPLELRLLRSDAPEL